ncbi:ArsR family transcriptional regulator [Haladaptatus sp. CMAA 1911]|uniref:ArsR family transcriptional regulator n=1 Tax=unclassified Haladaptatus TaxID=2622732 RepID=UPI0037542778
MRNRASWMNKATDPVLEILADTDYALPSGVIYYNLSYKEQIDVSRRTVLRALDPLKEHGLVKIATGTETYYEITDKGRKYLNGKLSTEDLEL